MIAAQVACLALMLLPTAAADDNVEWAGTTHIWWMDRRPLCPVENEAFDVLFQTYKFDIESASVFVDEGAGMWIDAEFDHDRGPYAVWRAEIPETTATVVRYYIAVTDGSDTDYISAAGMSEEEPSSADWYALNFNTLEHAPYGTTMVSGGAAVFRVWAPTPTQGYLRGDFNGWGTTPMIKTGSDFIGYRAGVDYRDMFKYYFSPGSIWKPDPRSRSLNPSDNLNNHVEDPFHYQWVETDFQTPPFEEMIIYEMHVGTFSGRNDPVASGSIPATYLDVAAHVDHFVDLGVNVIELMPITEFPWDYSAGYNPITQFAPEWKYGTPDELKYMIDVLHQNGIAVLTDIVWNHNSASDNFMWEFDGSQIYFDSPAVETPWGSQMDFDEAKVRDYLADSAQLWLEEYRIDGFRMDATDFMNSYQGSGWGLMQRLNNETDARRIDKIVIAEQLPDDNWVTKPTIANGAGFDSQWHDAFVDTLREEILDVGFGSGAEMWKINDIIDGSGQDMTGVQVVNYLEAHDEAWPTSGGQRFVKNIDTTFPYDDIYAKGRTKLAQGVVMFAQGIPMFLMGAEWLEYEDYGSGNEAGDNRIDWDNKDVYSDIYQFFKDMIAVRRSNCALRADAGIDTFHLNESGDVIAWQRWDLDGNIIVVIANFSNTNYPAYGINFPQGGTWYEILNSQASVYGGNGWGNGGSVWADTEAPHGASVVVPQMGLLVLRHENAPGRTSDLDYDGDVDLADFILLQERLGENGCGLEADIDEDGRTDIEDFNAMYGNFTGPN